MAFTEEEGKRIGDALQAKAPTLGACPLCNTARWVLQSQGFVFLGLQQTPGTISIGGPGLPLVAISCANCGNTMFLNLMILGLRDLVEQHQRGGPDG